MQQKQKKDKEIIELYLYSLPKKVELMITSINQCFEYRNNQKEKKASGKKNYPLDNWSSTGHYHCRFCLFIL